MLSRRRLLGGGISAAAAAAGAAVGGPILLRSGVAAAAGNGPEGGPPRRESAFQIRRDMALQQKQVPVPAHLANGDELTYPAKIGSFSKGLPHDPVRGEVDPGAYAALINALSAGLLADLEQVPLGCPAPALQSKLVNPLAGRGFDLEGTDSHQLMIPPAPAFASAEEAGEIVENYWMALLRDVPFAEYESHPLALAAAEGLSDLSDFKGPKVGGEVTTGTLFRSDLPGVLTGPYLSQLWWKDAPFGASHMEQRIRTAAAGVDYMTTFPEWLAIQNGCPPSAAIQLDPVRRHVINGRDLGQYVHVDTDQASYQAYLTALLVLLHSGVPYNVGNPYRTSQTQVGFGTFGAPHAAALLAEVTTRALKAVWFQKWFVHRRSRPEDFAARIHLTVTGTAQYPIHSDALSASVLGGIFERNSALNGGPGSYFLPMAFPEGCPLHPAYGAGHATIAGACATILKAFFDGAFILPDPVIPDPDDPTQLIPYNGPPLTVEGELNKLASNIAYGRNIAGVHWRSDAQASLLLGEEVAISILRDQRPTCWEQYNGLTFTRFDGQSVTI